MTIAMTPTTTVTIRRAQAADIPFLGWVMYTAARSHLTTCPWSAIFGTDEAETREILERLAETAAAHWCHVSKFWIAETDGTPAAAMAGFVPAIEGTPALVEAAFELAQTDLRYPPERLRAIGQRLDIASEGLPEDLPGIWAVENVAVLPEHRGKGLIDCLFERVLEDGRHNGFTRAQILCLIGNERGQRAWERNGFKVLSQRTSPAFDTLIGTPGAKLMARDL